MQASVSYCMCLFDSTLNRRGVYGHRMDELQQSFPGKLECAKYCVFSGIWFNTEWRRG